MKRYFLLSLLMFFLTDVRAQVVNSCDGSYSARVVGRGSMLIEHAGKKLGSIQPDHGIVGGGI